MTCVIQQIRDYNFTSRRWTFDLENVRLSLGHGRPSQQLLSSSSRCKAIMYRRRLEKNMNITHYINRVVLLKLETTVSGVEGRSSKNGNSGALASTLAVARWHHGALYNIGGYSGRVDGETPNPHDSTTPLPRHGNLARSVHPRSALSASCRIASRCVAPSRFATIVITAAVA